MADSPAIRSFKIDNGFDLSITLDIDTAVFTAEMAQETARFWSSKDEVLAASDDDDYQAVARYAAGRLWGFMIDGYNERGALEQLHKEEGWCYRVQSLGITIRDHEIPHFDAACYEVEVL